MRELVRELPKPFMWNNGHNAIGQRHQIMVEMLQRESVEVGEISRDMQCRNLAHARLHMHRTAKPAVDQQDAVLELLPFSDESLVRWDPSGFGNNALDGALFGGVDRVPLPQSPKVSLDHFAVLDASPFP
jgi:hypothetical protein